MRVSFDRGTLRLDGELPHEEKTAPGVVWDERVHGFRVAGYRYAQVIARAAKRGANVDDGVSRALRGETGPWEAPSLRPYQVDALRAFDAFDRRGLVVLPTGSGKTRVAIAALASARTSSLILCPTRALLTQWESELRKWFGGAVGIYGDGVHDVENVTVMTFESAYRVLDRIGDRFEMLVVDEAHHFGAGIRAEALEMCPAPMRLGLTATAPPVGTTEHARLVELIGPVVCEVGLAELVGTHLADFEVRLLGVRLDEEERAEYTRAIRPFEELRRAFARAHPRADWSSLIRALSQSPQGRAAIAGFHRAVAISSFPRAKQELVKSLLERHRPDKSLVFTALAEHAYDISTGELIPCVTSETPRAERSDILERFREGRLHAIVTARVLNEGIDVPDANVAIIVARSLGEREHVQRIGRVLRPSPGKRALVYELVTAQTIDDRRAQARRRKRAA